VSSLSPGDCHTYCDINSDPFADYKNFYNDREREKQLFRRNLYGFDSYRFTSLDFPFEDTSAKEYNKNISVKNFTFQRSAVVDVI